MNKLLQSCYIGHLFGKITPDKKYWLCCGNVPSIGSYDEDGSFKKLWKSEKYNTLRQDLKDNLKEKNKEWDNACNSCPHYANLKEINEEGGIEEEFPKIGPREFQIEIGNPCNHRCDFCWSWSHTMLSEKGQWNGWEHWAKEFIEYDTVKTIVKDLKELGGCEEISISGGGEPFIVPRIIEMVKLIKDSGFKLKIFTNFSKITTDDIENFVKWGVDRFEVNISAGTEKTYCESRKLKSKDWTKLWERLNLLTEFKVKYNKQNPVFKYVIILTKDNIEEVDEIFELANKHKSEFLEFRKMIPSYNSENLSPTKTQLEIFNKKVNENFEKYYGYPNESYGYWMTSKKNDFSCYNEAWI